MLLNFELVGNLNTLLASEVRSGERAVTGAMKTATSRLKSDWRNQIVGAGLGRRLSNTIRSGVFPKGQTSLNAAGIVYSKAPHIVSAHAKGALIRSQNGFWLAIPTKAAGKSRTGGRITPAEWEQKTNRVLKLIYRPGRPGLLVDTGTLRHGYAPAFGARKSRGFKNRTVPIFILVPQVRLKKKLDLDAPARLAASAIPGDIVSRWQVANR